MRAEASDTQESQSGAGLGQKGPMGGNRGPGRGRSRGDEVVRSYYLGVGFIKYGRVFSWEKIRTLTLPSPHPTVKFKNINMCWWT